MAKESYKNPEDSMGYRFWQVLKILLLVFVVLVSVVILYFNFPSKTDIKGVQYGYNSKKALSLGYTEQEVNIYIYNNLAKKKSYIESLIIATFPCLAYTTLAFLGGLFSLKMIDKAIIYVSFGKKI